MFALWQPVIFHPTSKTHIAKVRKVVEAKGRCKKSLKTHTHTYTWKWKTHLKKCTSLPHNYTHACAYFGAYTHKQLQQQQQQQQQQQLQLQQQQQQRTHTVCTCSDSYTEPLGTCKFQAGEIIRRIQTDELVRTLSTEGKRELPRKWCWRLGAKLGWSMFVAMQNKKSMCARENHLYLLSITFHTFISFLSKNVWLILHRGTD